MSLVSSSDARPLRLLAISSRADSNSLRVPLLIWAPAEADGDVSKATPTNTDNA